MPRRADWLLLALSAAGDGHLTPVQLQKAMFLMEREAGERMGSGFYSFRPYNYGPFDAAIYDDVATLEREGLLLTDRSHSVPRHTLTPSGTARAGHLVASVDPDVRTFLDTVVKWIKPLPFDVLLRAIYQKYPTFAVNSVFRSRQ